MIPVLLYPGFDPVMLRFGPFAIRWYALAYILGLVVGWRLLRRLVGQAPRVASREQVDDFLSWATLGVVLGGMLGVVIATLWFARRAGIDLLGFADRLAVCAPIGLGFGRIANFINGELWGRAAPEWLPWAMIFPQAGPEPRHPSQIYQALLEGLVLFLVLFLLSRRPAIRARFGLLSGVFLAGYAIARLFGELFREPDAFLGFLAGGLTMGQLLSLPMLLAGGFLIFHACRRRRVDLA